MRALICIVVLLIASPAFAHHRCHVKHRCCTTQVAATPCVAPAVVPPEPAPAPVVVAPDSATVQEKTTVKERRRTHVEHQHRGETIVAPEPAK